MLAWNGRCLPMRGLVGNCVAKASQQPKYFSVGNLCFNSNSHYDSLGVTPHATHTDIKSAYYRLSMLYHPDKNKGSVDASIKFRDICAAYEVLGNFKLRKLYDKGILHTASGGYAAHTHHEPEEDDSTTKFYKSRLKRNAAPTATGRTPIYNFDEWSRSHYGAAFARADAAKKKYERKQSKVIEEQQDIQKEVLIFSIAVFVMALFFTTLKNSESHDIVATPIKRSGEDNKAEPVKTI